MPVRRAVITLIVVGHRAWFGQAIIKEALIIVMPGNTAELAPADDFRIIGTIINLADLTLLPVAATTRYAVGQQLPIFAQGLVSQGCRTVFAEGVGINHNHCFTLQGVLHVEDGLILHAGVFGEEIAISPFDRRRIFGIVPQDRHALLYLFTGGNS